MIACRSPCVVAFTPEGIDLIIARRIRSWQRFRLQDRASAGLSKSQNSASGGHRMQTPMKDMAITAQEGYPHGILLVP